MTGAPSWRRTAGDVALLLLAIVPIGIVLVPAHWTSIWMDREFQGWMIAVANRLANGPPLYADGAHSPMPPIPFVIELLVGGGHGTWRTESALNVVFQALILLGMYAALASSTRWPIPVCATLAATPVIFSIHKVALHDSVAQSFAAWATMAVVRGLGAGAPATRGAGWRRAAALLNALCALSKQSTALGLTAGILAAYLLADPGRRASARLARMAAHLGWTLLSAALLALLLSPVLSLPGLVEDVYILGADPKGGATEALRNLRRYARQVVPPLATFGPLALGLGWLAHLSRRRGQAAHPPAGGGWLLAASVATAMALLGLALSSGAIAPEGWSALRQWIGQFYLDGDRVLWTGLWLGLIGAVWALVRRAPAAETAPWTAMILVLVPTALAHNLSTNQLRWTYDNNPLVVLALACVGREIQAIVQPLGARTRAVACGALGIVLPLGTFAGLQPQLAVARQCTETWPEVAHLRGARLRPRAEGMRELVRLVRALNGPEDRVLLLPEDPNVAAWLERPRPRLTSAVAFADQYWDRFVDEDVRRLTEAPPKTIIVGPRRAARRFARLFGHRDWGVERLTARIERELLPHRYVLHRSHVIAHGDKNDRMDVYVRRDSP